jgi:hypothetical protein
MNAERKIRNWENTIIKSDFEATLKVMAKLNRTQKPVTMPASNQSDFFIFYNLPSKCLLTEFHYNRAKIYFF